MFVGLCLGLFSPPTSPISGSSLLAPKLPSGAPNQGSSVIQNISSFSGFYSHTHTSKISRLLAAQRALCLKGSTAAENVVGLLCLPYWLSLPSSSLSYSYIYTYTHSHTCTHTHFSYKDDDTVSVDLSVCKYLKATT